MAFEETKYNNKFPDNWEWAGNKTIEGYDTEGGKYQPPDELKEQGFTPGYKPPAEFFNWFWRKVIKCVREIQTLFKSHREAEVIDHPDGSVTLAKLADDVRGAMLSAEYDAEHKRLILTGGAGSGGGGGSASLPIATADVLGGIKIGVGIDMDDDGTANVKPDVRADEIMTAEEAAEIINRIFSEEGLS